MALFCAAINRDPVFRFVVLSILCAISPGCHFKNLYTCFYSRFRFLDSLIVVFLFVLKLFVLLLAALINIILTFFLHIFQVSELLYPQNPLY